jgi:hypothetical protein
MRPVPRFSGTTIRDTRSESHKAISASNLAWRVSREVAPVNPPQPVTPSATETVLMPSYSTIPTASGVRQIASPVLQAKYQNTLSMPQDEGGLTLPPGLQSPPESSRQPGPTDFFVDPFGEESAPTDSPSLELPSPVPPMQNELRRPEAPSIAPPSTQPSAPPSAAPIAPPDAPQPAPPTAPLGAPNPFDRSRSDEERAADTQDRRQLEDFEMPLRPSDGDRPPLQSLRDREEGEELLRPVAYSCDAFRQSIREDKIQNLSLDISPPFRPDVIEQDEFEKLKKKFDEAQEVRDWQSVDGRKLGRGRLRDLAYEKVVIETEFGTLEELPIDRVSEADLAYLSKNWGLPQECLIEQAAYAPRAWQHAKVTWKASNLCHKPLYFEEVNLERYGHTAGPFIQPIVSSAHFFANIAVLPYKMGVHSPSECQYTLGYYRPGNCAPWIVPPVPISVRGGLYQAAAMTGAFWLIP